MITHISWVGLQNTSTPRGHDHRSRWTELFDTSISESGTIDSTAIGVDVTTYGLPKELYPLTCDPNEIIQSEVKIKGGMQFEDSMVTCRLNTAMNISMLTEALRAVTGWDFTVEEAMATGLRAVNLMRVFNLLSGLTSDMNRPSPRYGSMPVDGPNAGKTIFSHFDRMLKEYYEGMGWDEEGRPLPDTLKKLGLEMVAKDLWG